jgi:integrase
MPKRKSDQDGLYRRGDSPYWWVSYTDSRGRRTRRSTGSTDRREANRLLSKWKLEAHREQHWGEQRPHTFDEMMLAYLEETGNRKRSADRDIRIARHLYPFFSGRELESLTATDVHDYIVDRRKKAVKDATIRRELALLSSAINHARKWWDWNLPNPVIGRRPVQDKGRVRWLSRTEAAKLIEAAAGEPRAPHLADFIRLALHTGMRKGEMLGLEWSRVGLQDGLIYLEPHHTKTAERRTVPLNGTARAALISLARFRASHCPDSPWVFCNRNGERIQDIKKGFATACRRAGITDFHPHDMRHNSASWIIPSTFSMLD